MTHAVAVAWRPRGVAAAAAVAVAADTKVLLADILPAEADSSERALRRHRWDCNNRDAADAVAAVHDCRDYQTNTRVLPFVATVHSDRRHWDDRRDASIAEAVARVGHLRWLVVEPCHLDKKLQPWE